MSSSSSDQNPCPCLVENPCACSHTLKGGKMLSMLWGHNVAEPPPAPVSAPELFAVAPKIPPGHCATITETRSSPSSIPNNSSPAASGEVMFSRPRMLQSMPRASGRSGLDNGELGRREREAPGPATAAAERSAPVREPGSRRGLGSGAGASGGGEPGDATLRDAHGPE